MIPVEYQKFISSINNIFPPERIFSDDFTSFTYGTDASFYRLNPKVVVKVKSELEVASLIKKANEFNLPVTFRGAGTSLSGQAISDSILVLIDPDWDQIHINEALSEISLQPGVKGGMANLRLKAGNRKLGPDPASINHATIGGIAANNASGMTSGVKNNIYNTLEGIKIVFADGEILDTRDEGSRENFKKNKKALFDGIKALSRQVKSDKELRERISRKFKMKNTTGYGLNALIDFEDPIDIISHLMIGSEGTLGFISEITLRTVPDLPFKATSLMLFKNLQTACSAIPILKQLPVDAAEIMDRAALKSVENKDGIPEYIKDLAENASALLVETSANTPDTLNQHIRQIKNSLIPLEKLREIEFTTLKSEYQKLWDIRKGLFPSVCITREPGTTVIIEDVNFPLEKLADAAVDLQKLFKKHKYNESIIWGHSLSGNLHFVFYQDFGKDGEIARYNNFINDITRLVVQKYDGSLKAEHGTGRNMAPFVKMEWGEKAYDLMRQIKNIFDPGNLLNPGVILNPDDNIHLKNLKILPRANQIIDKCIECGFCESNCPSRDLTLTPRQRIAAWREISRLNKSKSDPERLNKFIQKYNYAGNQTCATDGLCALSCPVDIDTGKLIKEIRASEISPLANGVARVLSENMRTVTAVVRAALSILYGIYKIFGEKFLSNTSIFLRKFSADKLPLWTPSMPKGGKRIKLIPSPSINNEKVVYFPSCISRSMGPASNSKRTKTQTEVIVSLLNKAGYEVIYPRDLDNLCCGMAFSSKGYFKQGDRKSEELNKMLLESSQNGKYPVLFDTSPCLLRMREYLSTNGNNNLKIFDSVEFILEFLINRLGIKKIKNTVTVHNTCSVTKMGLEAGLLEIANLCAEGVIVPENVGCCGFAGDRGFTYPELNTSALRNLAPAVSKQCSAGYSTSKTCEIGLSSNSGLQYDSIFYLIDEASGKSN